jgi:Fe2+ transport system protein FeoA
MPLTFVPGGDTVVVSQIRGGKKIRSRLFDLGLNLNARIRVVKNDGQGPLIIAVKEDGRFALGKGMAHHIFVKDENGT